MKLNCGPTINEKRRAKAEKHNRYVERIMQWHKWFAWFPVRVNSRDCRWLEYVERKDNGWWRQYFLSDWERHWGSNWEYRAIP